jgi:hypothetical protein
MRRSVVDTSGMEMNVGTHALKGLFLGVFLLVGACGGGSKPPPGSPCVKNSDCTNPLSCSYGLCHVTCTQARDCPTGQDCVKAPSGNVCQLPVEAKCEYLSQCAPPLVCALDRQCRSQCLKDIDCPTPTQKCVLPDMVCAEPGEINQTTGLLDNSLSTPVPAAPPDAGAGDGATGDAGEGGSADSGDAAHSGGCWQVAATDGGGLVNGDFEIPIIQTGTFLDIGAPGVRGPSTSSVTNLQGFGWCVVTSDVAVMTSSFLTGVAPGILGPAYHGNQMLNLAGSKLNGAIEQAFQTEPGVKYAVTFANANDPAYTTTASGQVTVRDSANTILLSDTFVHNTSTVYDFEWTLFRGVFTATSAVATLEFNNLTGNISGGIILDDVAVTPVPDGGGAADASAD